MKQISDKTGRLQLTDRSGLSLVETVVAAAIIAIAAVTMVVAFTTIGNVSLQSEQLSSSDEDLQHSIAMGVTDAGQKMDSQDYEMQFSDGTNSYSVDGKVETYTSDSGDSFSLFTVPEPSTE